MGPSTIYVSVAERIPSRISTSDGKRKSKRANIAVGDMVFGQERVNKKGFFGNLL